MNFALILRLFAWCPGILYESHLVVIKSEIVALEFDSFVLDPWNEMRYHSRMACWQIDFCVVLACTPSETRPAMNYLDLNASRFLVGSCEHQYWRRHDKKD